MDHCHPFPTLTVIPCGKAKIFSSPALLAKLLESEVSRKNGKLLVRAQSVYTSRVFGLYWRYSKRFAHREMILSAKYGLLQPDTFIEDYDATFTKPNKHTISLDELRAQAEEEVWSMFEKILLFGGKAYRSTMREILPKSALSRVVEPLAGKDLPGIHSELENALRV